MTLPTPISVIETYFEQELTPTNLKFWDEIPEDTWVDFAKTYRAVMKGAHTPQALANQIAPDKVRLYFDYRYRSLYGSKLAEHSLTTPLLCSPYPPDSADFDRDFLAVSLAPLRKHLLVSDELCLPDNFFSSFDFVAEVYDKTTWRNDPNVAYSTRESIQAIRRWLPILAGLRDLITSRALSFVPYYVIPSFPYANVSPNMWEHAGRLDIPPDPRVKSAGSVEWPDFTSRETPRLPKDVSSDFDPEAALSAWLNARMLGTDPVFPDEDSWRWASGIRSREQTAVQATSDLMSIDLLPLGDRKGLSVEDIQSMRKNEKVFTHIRDTLIGCRAHIIENVAKGASTDLVRKVAREYVRDELNPEERLGALKFLDNNFWAATVLSVAIGAALLKADPWVGLLVPAVLTPKAILEADKNLNPKGRALGYLEALL